MKETQEKLRKEREEKAMEQENFTNSKEQKNKTRKAFNNELGITLIALVVTIVVLLILAGITINLLFSNGGIFKTAEDAADAWNKATINEQESLDNIADQIANLVNGQVGGQITPGEDEPVDETPKVADNLGTVISITENTDLTDSLNNKITVPAGFFIVTPEQDNTIIYDYLEDGTPTVQDGIVIQNETDGNQFVWIPVGTINNKEGDTLGEVTTIKLGRYRNFTAAPVQEATTDSYNTAVIITSQHFEVSDTFTGDSSQSLNAASSYGNTKATNLQEWINTTLANGGYYIARYEASQNATETTKAASVRNVQPWVNITQPDAATAAKATYAVDGQNSNNYYSDLINSYAWDTAIVFIRAYEDRTYSGSNNSTSSTVTGRNKDQVCNINDMSGNREEWTTETSKYMTSSEEAFPCTVRGGSYRIQGRVCDTENRSNCPVDETESFFSFRFLLCVK